MEQKPIVGAAPLDPPSADLARQYLDEASAVAQRREKHLDRRGMAVLRAWETGILAVYLTVFMFSFGATGSNAPFVLLFVVFFPWIQFSSELRMSFGFQARGSKDARRYLIWGAIVVAAFIGAMILQMSWGEFPLWARYLPGALCLLLLGPSAARELRQTRPGGFTQQRELPSSARVVTIALGVLLAATLWITALGDALFASIWVVLPMIVIVAWTIGCQVSTRIPALGALWRWPQWSAYGISSLIIVVFVFARAHAIEAGSTIVTVAALLIVALFTVSAFLRGRDV